MTATISSSKASHSLQHVPQNHKYLSSLFFSSFFFFLFRKVVVVSWEVKPYRELEERLFPIFAFDYKRLRSTPHTTRCSLLRVAEATEVRETRRGGTRVVATRLIVPTRQASGAFHYSRGSAQKETSSCRLGPDRRNTSIEVYRGFRLRRRGKALPGVTETTRTTFPGVLSKKRGKKWKKKKEEEEAASPLPGRRRCKVPERTLGRLRQGGSSASSQG